MSAASLLSIATGVAAGALVRRASIRRPGPVVVGEAPRSDLLGAAGLALQRRVPLLGSLSPRVVGLSAVTICAVSLVNITLGVAAVGGTLSTALARRIGVTRRRRRRLVADLPVAIEVMRMAVASGLTLSNAVVAVGRDVDGPAGAPFAEVGFRHDRGHGLADALTSVGEREGEPIAGVFALLATTQRSGSPVSVALARVAERQRRSLRRDAEARARRLPVALLLPLVTCVMPSFALLTIVPILAGGVGRINVL